MNSKERLMRALDREKPDRLPATVHQWQPYHLAHYMGGMTQLDAFKACGLDAALFLFPICEEPETPQWRTRCDERVNANGETVRRWEIQTPGGSLHYTTITNEMTTWHAEHPVKRDEDIYLIQKYMPISRLLRDKIAAAYDELGDAGILRGFLAAFGCQGGPWQEAVEWCGLETMLMATCTKPDWVHEFLRILLEKRLAFIEQEMPGAKLDLVETGGGAGSDTCVSPKIFRQFLLPYDRIMHDALHQLGFKIVYHTCGGMVHILDLIAKNHCDAAETLTPPSMGGNIDNATMVKERLGQHVCLIGGMDQTYVLKRQEGEGIRAEVRRLFETYGRDGGYIMAPCDHFFDLEHEKLEFFAQAAAECRYD